MKIIIPARKGSKGVPFKNRELLLLTLETIPENIRSSCIISTDDDFIKKEAISLEFIVHDRTDDVSKDDSSMKQTINQVVKDFEIKEHVIVLLLTYPERTWLQVEEAYKCFIKKSAKSLLCRQDVLSHPYLCFYELPDDKGKSVVGHSKYRRQDFPVCFHVRHMICIFDVKELNKLNENLYNEDTIYYKIENTLDVDNQSEINLVRNKK